MLEPLDGGEDLFDLIGFGLSVLVLDVYPRVSRPRGLEMAFGDGVTGIARNLVARRRSKSPIGSLFMLLVCVPTGWLVGRHASPPIPEWGVISAVVATVVERYELGPIDDNILITVSAAAVLLLGSMAGPIA
jgi:phytol kinase